MRRSARGRNQFDLTRLRLFSRCNAAPVHVNQLQFQADELIPAGITTPFLLYRNVFAGECVYQNGFSYLEISLQLAPNDQRAEPPYHKQLVEGVGFGLHLVDYNLPLDDLIDAVAQQAAAMP